MTFLKRLKAFCLASLMATTPFTSWADAGHDHGTPASTEIGSGLPRFSAVSETFELVGLLNGKQLSLYLDRAADNSPVRDAQLDLELGGVKLDVKSLGEGEFGATLAQELKPGVTAVVATVVAGQETDLLSGDLNIRDDAPAMDAASKWPWKKYGAWLLAGLLTLAGLAWGLRRVRSHRSIRLGEVK